LQERCPDPVGRADHQVPGSSCVGLSHGLDYLHRRNGVGFQTTILDRNVHSEQSRIVHRRQYGSGQAALAFALVTTVADNRAEMARGCYQIGCVGFRMVQRY
jgi:hypothetical protein